MKVYKSQIDALIDNNSQFDKLPNVDQAKRVQCKECGYFTCNCNN